MTIDLDTCDEQSIRQAFKLIISGAKLIIEKHADEFTDTLTAASGDTGEPHWADVLVDIVLSLLPASNSKTTDLLGNGIRILAKHITPAVVDSFVQALTSSGQDSDDEDSGDDDGDEDGEEAKSGNEDSGDSGDDDDDDDEVVEDETELDAFKQKLHSILSQHGSGGDQGAGDEDGDDVVLADEAMEGLDQVLTEGIQGTNGRKESAVQIKKEQDDFRCRVLNIYSFVLHKRDIELELIVPLMPALVSLLRTLDVSDGSIGAKALTIITRIKKLKFTQRSLEVDGLLEAVEACFALTAINMPVVTQNQVAGIVVWLIKVSRNTNKQKEVETLVQKLSAEAMNRKTTNKTFFTDLSRSSESTAFALIESRLEKAFDPNIKKQKRALEASIIATALPRDVVPDHLFDTLWQKSSAVISELLSEAKFPPELLSANIRILGQLKRLKQGKEKPLDDELQAKIQNLTGGRRKRISKVGQRSLKALVIIDKEKRSNDSKNAKRRRDNPYLQKKAKPTAPEQVLTQTVDTNAPPKVKKQKQTIKEKKIIAGKEKTTTSSIKRDKKLTIKKKVEKHRNKVKKATSG